MAASRRVAALSSAVALGAVLGLTLAGPALADPTPYPTVTGTSTPTGTVSPTGSTSPTGTAPTGSSAPTGPGTGTGSGTQLVAGITVRIGEEVYVSFALPDGHVASLDIHSTVVHVATVTGNSTGRYTASFTIPSGLEAGEHHLIITDTTAGSQIADIPFTLAAGGANSGGSSGGGTAATGIAVAGFSVVGLGLIGGGGALLLAGRRRRAHA